jgi:serine/threonine protein phosphatase 1
MLLNFLADPGVGPDWWQFGGGETLGSYGLGRPIGQTAQDWGALSEAFAAALPEAHIAFLSGLPLKVVCGDYAFVHAGFRPGVPIHDQSKRDMLWIRNDFLSDTRAFEKVVVHGHTPEPDVYLDQRRIGLDTGAYASGVLSAIRLHADTQRIIQVAAG